MGSPPTFESAQLPPIPGAWPSQILPNITRLPPLPVTSPGAEWFVDFDDLEAYNNAKVVGKYSIKLKHACLASEKQWKYRIGKGWRGVKVLGIGGQGIVGHWRYEGTDRDHRGVKDIAVKQALRSGISL